MTRAIKWLIGLGVVALICVLFVNSRYGIMFGATQSWPHKLQMTVPSAFEAIPGERVVAGGNTVGEITEANVTRTGKAHLVLGVNNQVWPIPDNSTLYLRMGGTIKFTDRYVEIVRGTGKTDWAQDASVPANQFIVPVEYNQLFNIFTPSTRAGLTQLFDRGGPTFQDAAAPFNAALPEAPPALNQVADVFTDLDDVQDNLSTLVSTGASLTHAVATSNPGLQDLLTGAASTFAATSASSRQISQLLQIGTRGDDELGGLLNRASGTLYPVAELSRRLEPGLSELDHDALPLDTTLGTLVTSEPDAQQTLDLVNAKGPQINDLLVDARTDLLPQATKLVNLATPIVNCLRPYTPDIMNFFLDFPGVDDAFDNPKTHFLHVGARVWPFTNMETIDSQQLEQEFPGIQVENPMPPGQSYDQPWYQPDCGTSTYWDSAAGDSNEGTYDPNASKSVPYTSTTPQYSPGPTPRTLPTRTSADQTTTTPNPVQPSYP